MAGYATSALNSFITKSAAQKTSTNWKKPSTSTRMVNNFVTKNTAAKRISPMATKNVFAPNAPRPQRGATADIAAPINEGGKDHVGSVESAVNTPTVSLPETTNPSADPIADMGRAANQGEEMLYQKREEQRMAREAALAAQQNAGGTTGGGVPGEFTYDGGSLGGLDAEQSKYAALIIQQGKQRGLNDADIQTALMTALAESGIRNLNYGDRDSVGLFQQRTSQGWGSIDQIMDPNYSIGKFYDSLMGIGNRGGMSQWQAAQAVQRSAFADGSNYKDQYNQAMNIWKSYSQGAVTAPKMGSNGSASWINSNNGKYHDYDGAYGAQCVDLYNFYATGFVGANPNQARVVGAKDIWNNYDTGAFTRIARSNQPQQGDVVVWDSSWGGGYGHVGIVAGVNPDGTLKVLNANATSAGPQGNTVMSNYGMGGVLGFLRPNKLMGR